MIAASFKGGLALPIPSQGEPQAITTVPVPDRVVVPLMHDQDQNYELFAKKGKKIKQGEVLAQGTSSVVLASIAGKIEEINKGFRLPSGEITTAVSIAVAEEESKTDPAALRDSGYLQKVLNTGVADLTDRPIPLLEKIASIRTQNIQTLIINCLDEFFIWGRCSALLAQHTADVLSGIQLLLDFSGAQKAVLVVYAEASQALQALETSDTSFEIIQVKARHPQHKAQLLVTTVTGQEYDIDQTPEDLGLTIISPETAYWASRALNQNEPAVNKLLTVAGGSLQEPQNCFVRIGTPLAAVLEHLGQNVENGDKVILGGPLSGQAIADLNLPVTSETHLLFIQKKAGLHSFSQDAVCFKCGLCVEICPMRLMPFLISGFSEGGSYDLAEKNNIFTCIECGCCAYVCPVNIPMVQWIQLGKSAIHAQRS